MAILLTNREGYLIITMPLQIETNGIQPLKSLSFHLLCRPETLSEINVQDTAERKTKGENAFTNVETIHVNGLLKKVWV